MARNENYTCAEIEELNRLVAEIKMEFYELKAKLEGVEDKCSRVTSAERR